MALIKWGSIVVDGRGKIGGQVYSKNRSGSYVRNKVTPVNPRTSYQQTARQQLGNLSSQWKGLTEAQRQAWRDAVGLYEKTNIFGDTVQPSGKNLFVGLNRNLANAGQSAITAPVAPGEFPIIVFSAIGYAAGTFNIQTNNLGLGTDYTLLIFATAPQSAGVDFVSSEYRLIDTASQADTSAAIDITTAYTDRFGAGTVGLKVFVKVVLIENASGAKGVPITDSTIVTA